MTVRGGSVTGARQQFPDEDAHPGKPDLALVVGAARSGTTLVRLLLDAHPEIGCPAEAALPALLSHLAAAWLAVHADQLPDLSAEPDRRWTQRDEPWTAPTDGPPPTATAVPAEGLPAAAAPTTGTGTDRPFGQISVAGRRWLVDTVGVPMAAYCSDHGKRLYCDKSLNSVHHLPLVRELFPAVRTVLVFRHVMDTIASGVEASPWGFTSYGYEPFIQASPGNSVAALASYWLSHVEQALAWEAADPQMCLRVRYEDLVSAPGDTIDEMFEFLGVAPDRSVLVRAFEAPRNGPGDHKIGSTSAVHTTSLGHGKRVPVNLLPPALLKDVNRALVRLGYDAVGAGWNAQQRGSADVVENAGHAHLRAVLDSAELSPLDVPGTVALAVDDHPGLRWVITPSSGAVIRGDGHADRILTGSAQDLLAMIAGEESRAVLLRAGRIRHLTVGGTTDERHLRRELGWIAEELRRIAGTVRPAERAEAPLGSETDARSGERSPARPAGAWL